MVGTFKNFKLSILDGNKNFIVKEVSGKSLDVEYHTSLVNSIGAGPITLKNMNSREMTINFSCILTKNQFQKLDEVVQDKLYLVLSNGKLSMHLKIHMTEYSWVHQNTKVIFSGESQGEPWELNGFDKILLYSKKVNKYKSVNK